METHGGLGLTSHVEALPRFPSSPLPLGTGAGSALGPESFSTEEGTCLLSLFCYEPLTNMYMRVLPCPRAAGPPLTVSPAQALDSEVACGPAGRS